MERVKRKAYHLDTDVHRYLKATAAMDGVPIRDVINRVVREHMTRKRARRVTATTTSAK